VTVVGTARPLVRLVKHVLLRAQRRRPFDQIRLLLVVDVVVVVAIRRCDSEEPAQPTDLLALAIVG